MLLRRFLFLLVLFISFFSSPNSVNAQVGEGMKQPRLLILLDESSSMIMPWTKNKERYKAAEDIIISLFDSIYGVNKSVEFGLRAFGEQYNVKDSNCYDTKREVNFSGNNRTQLQLRLEDLHPLGVTPIAYSLQKAAEEDLTEDYKYFYNLVLITDGGESCGGDLCAIARMLMQRKIHFKPYIISLVDNPALKLEYDCLGNYLQVTSEADVPKAVGVIMEQYRPMLNILKSDLKKLESAVVNTPSMLKVDIPAFKITKEVPADKPVVKEVIPVEKPPVKEVVTPRAETPPPPKPRVKETIGYVPLKKITAPKPAKLYTDLASPLVAIPHIPMPPPNEPKVEAPPPPKPRVKENIAYLSPKKIYAAKPNKAYIAPVTRPVIIPRIPMPPPNENAITVTPKKPKVTTPPPPKEPSEKLVSYVLQTAESPQTMVEIYFTDGKGKFYSTTPEIAVADANTGKEVKRFIRTVNATGNPVPQKLDAGTYTLKLPGKLALVARNVPIIANKVNKLTIVVNGGSLHFAYEGKPDKPVSEFMANVTERVIGGGGPTVSQKCDLDLEYPTGTYHITVNTVPRMERYVDIEFDNVTVITVDEPGYLQITNEQAFGRVELFTPKNDNYVKFLDMDINGNPNSQRVRIQPGLYELRYNKTPNVPVPNIEKVRFTVKSNDTTQLELKR